MNIVIDFDGTCVTHVMPGIGVDIGAASVLRELVLKGNNLILFTMRPTGKPLDQAVEWFRRRDITLYGIQSNPSQSIWTNSPKAYGDLIIDDLALGVPLTSDSNISDKPFVDWNQVRQMLVDKGLI